MVEISETVHRRAKARAKAEGLKMYAVVERALESYLADPSPVA